MATKGDFVIVTFLADQYKSHKTFNLFIETRFNVFNYKKNVDNGNVKICKQFIDIFKIKNGVFNICAF